MSGNDAEHRIREAIRTRGSLAFPEFLGIALYDPEVGYYASGKMRIGRAGDFYTNVSVGPVFGEIMARQFHEMWRLLAAPARFAIVEQGVGRGQFAADVMARAASIEQRFRDALQYFIVEPFEPLRKIQKEALSCHGSLVRWVEDENELQGLTGVHFSNELVDAFPFHVVRFSAGRWWERRVVSGAGEGFAWEDKEPVDPALVEAIATLPRCRQEGFTTEIRTGLNGWLAKVANIFEQGWILVSDYGMPSESYYSEDRREGTLSCFRNHRRDALPLENSGDKDISAHVDFTALARAGRNAGLNIAGYCDQYHFLVGVTEEWLRSLDGRAPAPDDARKLRGLQTLLHPESMGRQFKYLGFGKNIPPDRLLSGFRHARAFEVELNL